MAVSGWIGAQDLDRHLVRPETIHQSIDELGISPETHRKMSRLMTEAAAEMRDLQAEWRRHQAKLESLTDADPLPAAEIAAAADALFEAEKAHRQRELEVLVALNGFLTAEQRETLIRRQVRTTAAASTRSPGGGAEPPSAPEKVTSFADLGETIESLREESVAWRKIDWKHCLLEGMAASRAEQKPILLWCHIDLPADDKRC